MPVETSRSGKKAKSETKKQAGKRAGAKSEARSSEAKAKNSAPVKPGTKSRRRTRVVDDPPMDMPTMYRVRMGRHGRTRLLTTRERLSLLRRSAARGAAFEAAASASPLRGTHEVLVHQNVMANGEGLQRIQDDEELDQMRANNDLVDFAPSKSLHVNPELPENRRCARPWTVLFAQDLGQEYYEKFGEPLMVTSAARSVTYQRRLTHVNGNAAGIEGEAASPHLTGQAIDIGKRGMSRAQLAWMRERLLAIMQAGEIDVEEEFRQACFHISVYRTYLPAELGPVMKQSLAQTFPLPATDAPERAQP